MHVLFVSPHNPSKIGISPLLFNILIYVKEINQFSELYLLICNHVLSQSDLDKP